ncbi:MAG: winged helix-turn-helix transcriptional regulator [Chloroflexi bacterium]|nr:winged helix-turn-helix transcriptional regulator [Chloroflexota bacterium]
MSWLLIPALILLVVLGLRLWEEYRIRRRDTLEDAIKYLYDCEEQNRHATPEALAGRLGLSTRATHRLLRRMAQRGLIRFCGTRVCLTPAGKALGLQLLRAHRLWERYLSDFTDVPLAEIHRLADKREHHLTPEEIQALEATLGYPRQDPHGDPIPTEKGETRAEVGVPLTDWPVGKPARIVHVEDEPEDLFAQALAEGLLPGVDVVIVEARPEGLHLKVDGNDVWIASIIAAQVHVIPAPQQVEEEHPPMSLADLTLGEKARVLGIAKDVRGLLRRRLLDLGFTRGAVVQEVLESAFGHGDPKAYRVRGTLIALRREQAARIYAEPVEDNEE